MARSKNVIWPGCRAQSNLPYPAADSSDPRRRDHNSRKNSPIVRNMIHISNSLLTYPKCDRFQRNKNSKGRNMKRLVIQAAFLLLVVSNFTFAQVNADLSGTVSDASGALIPGVEVTAKNINTGIAETRLTNETGNFSFPSLQPGSYTLSAALSGFQTASYNNVVLGQGAQVRLNFTLQVGAAAQNVEVTIAADTLLATTSASVGYALQDRDLLSLPLSTRNVLDVLAGTAGVVYTTNAF